MSGLSDTADLIVYFGIRVCVLLLLLLLLLLLCYCVCAK